MKTTTTAMTALDYRREFIRKHPTNWRVFTSSMNEYGNYVKVYAFDDGATLTEVNGPAWKDVTWTADDGRTETRTEKVWRTEIWHTDDATSRIWYERY